MKKIYMIAGEPSGDLHGAHLIEALLTIDPQIQIRGFGGAKMENAGARLDQTIDHLSFMGFSEVIRHLPVIFSNFRKAKKAIREWQPDAIVFIDFPGFNMRMAGWSRKQGFKNFYYISPQVWAWDEKRALKLKRDIDELFCILPFEESFFARFGMKVHYVGHPLVDIIRQYKEKHSAGAGTDMAAGNRVDSPTIIPLSESGEQKIIALLPGSRNQEVQKILPVQLLAVQGMDDFKVVIGKSPHVPQQVYDDIVTGAGNPQISYNEESYSLLDRAFVALVASGTATLETALFKVPEVVCFKGSSISYLIAKRLVKVPFISLVNLILEEEAVKELIQQKLTPGQLRQEILKLTDTFVRNRLYQQYNRLEEKLGLGGAAEKTAKMIIYKLEN